jgi:hypothetical protein
MKKPSMPVGKVRATFFECDVGDFTYLTGSEARILLKTRALVVSQRKFERPIEAAFSLVDRPGLGVVWIRMA